MTTAKAAHLWRHEIQHGPEGEADYAWVYDANGMMVCTAKTHHAEAIVSRMNTTASLQGEDAIRANNTANLISIIADIREKTGLGGKPMLNELADAIVAEMDRRVADEREKCAKIADNAYADSGWHYYFHQACNHIAAAIRSGGGE